MGLAEMVYWEPHHLKQGSRLSSVHDPRGHDLLQRGVVRAQVRNHRSRKLCWRPCGGDYAFSGGGRGTAEGRAASGRARRARTGRALRARLGAR